MNTTVEQHKHVMQNRSEIEKSDSCACCYCENDFSPNLIVKWIDNNQTALCPFCGIDAVIGSACGFNLTSDLLKTMHKEWFE